MPPPARRDGPWSPRQQRTILSLLLGLLALLSYRHLTRPTHVPNPLPPAGPRAAELPPTLDPNSAPWQQLSLLPNLGEKKAKAIVTYRDQFLTDHPDDLPFHTPDDLTTIPGIGPTTAANLAPYLSFPPPANPEQKPLFP